LLFGTLTSPPTSRNGIGLFQEGFFFPNSGRRALPCSDRACAYGFANIGLPSAPFTLSRRFAVFFWPCSVQFRFYFNFFLGQAIKFLGHTAGPFEPVIRICFVSSLALNSFPGVNDPPFLLLPAHSANGGLPPTQISVSSLSFRPDVVGQLVRVLQLPLPPNKRRMLNLGPSSLSVSVFPSFRERLCRAKLHFTFMFPFRRVGVGRPYMDFWF